MNGALKTKWIVRFAKAKDAPWRKVIISKYRAKNSKGGGAKTVLMPMGWVVGNLFLLGWSSLKHWCIF